MNLEAIDFTFFQHLGLLASVIVGLTIFKIVSCKPFKSEGESFDVKKLVLGLLGNALVAVAISIVYSAGSIWGENLLMIRFGETEMTIQYALDIMLMTAIGTYGAKMIRNFAVMIGVTKDIQPIEPEVQTTFNTDTVVFEDKEKYNFESDGNVG